MTTELTERAVTNLDMIGTKRPDQVLQLKYDVAEIMEKVLVGPSEKNPAGVHYGPSFPGSRKNSLLLPGAQTLASTFRLTPRYDVVEVPEGNGRRYQVRTKLYTMGGTFLGEGLGEASTEEEKFAWQEAVCDEEWEATRVEDRRVKYKRDKGGGHYTVKQVRASVPDRSNTCLKIGKKRSLVDGIILVLDCSDIFDQDFEELGEELGLGKIEPKEHKEHKPKPRPSPLMPYGPAKGKAITDATVDLHLLESMKDSIQVKLAKPGHDPKWDAQDKVFCEALAAEIAFRKTQERPPEQPKTPQEPSKAPAKGQTKGKAPDAPTEQPVITDSFFADLILSLEEDMPEIYKAAKAHFVVQSGHDVPKAQRQAFYDHVGMLMEQARK